MRSPVVDEALFQPELKGLIFCVVVFCATFHVDGVIYVDIVGCLFELWGLGSFDRRGIEWLRDVAELQCAHAKAMVSFKAARREPACEPPALFVARETAQHHAHHIRHQHCKQRSMRRVRVFFFFELRFEVSPLRAPQEHGPKRVLIYVLVYCRWWTIQTCRSRVRGS